MLRSLLIPVLLCPALGAQVVQEAFHQDPGPLDFIRGEGHEQAILQALTGDALLGLDAQGRPVARLALSWKAIPGGLRLELRPGARFVDGQSLEAEDVRWTFTQLQTRPEASPTRKGLLAGLGLKVLGPLALEVHSDRPLERLLVDLARVPIARRGQPSVGSGPFALERKQGEWHLLARPDHFLSPKLPGFRFRLIQDDQGQLQQLRKGWLSLGVPPARPGLEVPPALREFRQPTHAQMILWSRDPGRLRWIERWRNEALSGGFLGAQARASRGLWPEGLGFPPRALAGPPPPLPKESRWELLYGNGDELARKALMALRERAKRDGVDLELRPLEAGLLEGRITQGRFELACAFQLFDPHPWSVLDYLQPGGGLNFTGWSTPGYAELTKGLLAPGKDARWRSLEQRWAESAAALPILDFQSVVWVDRRLRVEPSALGLYLTTPGPSGWTWVP